MSASTSIIEETSSSIILRFALALKVQSSSHPMHKKQDITVEYTYLKNLRHPNIIGVGDFINNLQIEEFKGDHSLRGFTMELAESDLLEYLRSNHPNPLSPVKARIFFLGIANALQFIHAHGVAHNDVKLENILITNSQAKLSDFGFASEISESELNDKIWQQRTPTFLAPEILSYLQKKSSYSSITQFVDLTKTDVFAFGVCLFESLFFILPFEQKKATDEDLFYSFIVRSDYDGFWSIPQIKRLTQIYLRYYPQQETHLDELKDLLNNCLAKDPNDRLSFQQVIQHPWFASAVTDSK